MLLKLPVELIQRIVRLATPEEITSSTYQPRQDTLRNLCLVNSLLLAVVQPVLEEALWVGDDSGRAGRTVQVLQAQPTRVRFLWWQQSVSSWTDLSVYFPLLLSIREIRLGRLSSVDTMVLASMSSAFPLSSPPPIIFHLN
jgi:hypothetical protein